MHKPVKPTSASFSMIFPAGSRYRGATLAIQLLVVVLGALQTWNVRHTFDADGMSYVDLADRFLQNDWTGAVNGYWSPLYSLFLATVLRVTNPSPYWEFTVVHLANFATYLWTLVCFNVLLSKL